MIGKAHTVDLVLGAAVLALCIWMGVEARDFSPFASLFPTFITVTCGGFTVVLLTLAAMGRLTPPPAAMGSTVRRVVLCIVLAGWLALLPVAGFILASIPGFIGVGVAAKYDPWSPRQWLLFCLLAVASVVALSLFFAYALQVPLEQGSLFRG
ncbi:MAG: hypothetical protein Tsb0032_04880 [Kiloniellaceae bacterium]